MSLNDNLLSDIDNGVLQLLLISRRYSVWSECLKDTETPVFLWRENPEHDYVILVYIFGKVDSSFCTNWELPKTSPRLYQT